MAELTGMLSYPIHNPTSSICHPPPKIGGAFCSGSTPFLMLLQHSPPHAPGQRAATMANPSITEDSLKAKLRDTLKAVHVEITDMSGKSSSLVTAAPLPLTSLLHSLFRAHTPFD